MGSECYPRDCYNLCDSRYLIQGFADREESQDAREAREKENERTSKLSDKSKTLCHALKRNDALVSGINFGTHRLVQATNDTALPARRPIASVLSRPDTDDEEAVVHARLTSASHLEVFLVDILKQINQAILRNSIDSAIPSQEQTVQEPTVFYRVCHEESHTSHGVNLGFWCARGLPNHDFRKPVASEFRAHMEEDDRCVDLDNKRRRIKFKSPYISLTTDPGRALNIGHSHKRKGRKLQHYVYQIDATKLRKMKIVIESTTDIKRTHGITDFIEYVTDSHWLANFWVPAECIIGKLGFSDFEALCGDNEIIYDDKTYKATLERDLPTGEFKRKCESLLPSTPPPILVKFVADCDDETTPSVTPRRRKAPRSNPTAVNDDKSGEASTSPQNTAPADSELEQRLRALSVIDT